LKKVRPSLSALRDVDPDDLAVLRPVLADRLFRRVRHVVGEIARVAEAATALKQKRADTVGSLMVASHHSLRKDYQSSSPELDCLVELSLAEEGVFGARVTGAGFGGGVVLLVKEEQLGRFEGRVLERYRRKTGKEGFHLP
jgi:galactokinase